MTEACKNCHKMDPGTLHSTVGYVVKTQYKWRPLTAKSCGNSCKFITLSYLFIKYDISRLLA